MASPGCREDKKKKKIANCTLEQSFIGETFLVSDILKTVCSRVKKNVL